MRASDLSEDDIGREFIVTMPVGGAERRRVTFEGFTRRPAEMERTDGQAFWLIMKCSPGTPGILRFKTADGVTFTGLLVRSSSSVWPLAVEYAVTDGGDIVELGARVA